VLRGALLSVGLWLDDRGIMGQYRRHSSFAEGSTGVMVEGSLEASACIAAMPGSVLKVEMSILDKQAKGISIDE
jgi:hypothetical protein